VINTSNKAITEAVAHLRELTDATGDRLIIGIVGAPGTGKSTIAELIAQSLGDEAAVVPMDGFHLANAILDGTPLKDRKGAIDTFDVGGFVSLLTRLRARDEDVVYAPAYRRGLEEPIAASIVVPESTRVVITEGNYLLADDGGWKDLRGLLDETWFVDTPQATRLSRLIERHVASGMNRRAATDWANGPDESNARFINSTRHHANRTIQWT
jgi:pantothenate kinase